MPGSWGILIPAQRSGSCLLVVAQQGQRSAVSKSKRGPWIHTCPSAVAVEEGVPRSPNLGAGTLAQA